MLYVWDAFMALSRARQGGMGPNPITYLEIAAFQRVTLTPLTAWAVRLIAKLDEAALKAWSEDAKKTAPRPTRDRGPAEIAVHNTAGLKALFHGLKAKKASQFGPNTAAPPTIPRPRRRR